MYKALYRKYRPSNFDEVVGQDRIVEILKNQISEKKVGHAYLFSGLRGSGKTSIAKIFAKAINCRNPHNGNPCLTCDICKSVAEGKNADIIEMDAASNNGVNDIRLIRDEITFVPTLSDYKVYIIDEVHMLSAEAFNALLKTLEEPPSHVKFILATTEPQKLPETILSRCQKFSFKKISENDIFNHLVKIAEKENITIEKKAIEVIATLAKGSMRDAISILDSVSILPSVNKNDVRDLVLLPSSVDSIKTVKYMLEGNSDEVVKIINKNFENGKEAVGFLEEVLRILNELLISKKNNIYDDEENEILDSIDVTKKMQIYKIMKECIDIFNNIKYGNDRNVIFLAGILKISEEIRTKNVEIEEQKERNIENAKKTIEVLKKNANTNLNVFNLDTEYEKNRENKEDNEDKEEVVKQEKLKKEERDEYILPINLIELRKEILKKGNVKLFAILGKVKMATRGLKIGFKISKLTEDERKYLKSTDCTMLILNVVKSLTDKDVNITFVD